MAGTTGHDFWVHGLEVHVQNEPDPIATEAQLPPGYSYPNPRRNSQGTKVIQNGGSNWFHFAIPTPIVLRPDTEEHHLEVRAVLLRGKGNRCGIKAVHVWGGGAGAAQKIWTLDFVTPDRLDGEFDNVWDFSPYYVWEEPLAIDICVQFEEEGADITFGGAGVRVHADIPDWVYGSSDAPCLSR